MISSIKQLLLLLPIVLGIHPQIAFAVEGGDSSSESLLGQKVLEARETLEAEEQKQRRVLSGLYELNRKIKSSVVERGNLIRERSQLEESIENLEIEIQENTEALVLQKRLLSERLRAIYKFGGNSGARLIFGAANPTVLDRNLRILGVIAKKDRELITNYTFDLKNLAKRKERLVNRLSRLKEIETKILKKEQKLVAEQNIKNKLLTGIRKNKIFAINRIEDLKKQAGSINLEDSGLLDVIYRPSFGELKGELSPPVRGVLRQGYGMLKSQAGESKNKWTLSHKGLLFAVPSKQEVQSVWEGTIAYVDRIPGYGQTIILDHGDHYYTVYSGAMRPLVQAGQAVTARQNIASFESSSSAVIASNELYFEIRHFSETYDPKDWMKGLSL